MTVGYNPGPSFRLRSGYGPRKDPVAREKGEFHPGFDFSAAEGTPIPAATSGKVVYSGFNDDFGNVVIVQNVTGGYSLYGHMQGDDQVAPGQRVWRGDTIGRVGSTGRSTGPHLHYSIIGKDAGRPLGVGSPRNGGAIGIHVNDKTTTDPARYDYDPPYLDETRRAAQIMSGNQGASQPSPEPRSMIGDRFGNWGTSSAGPVSPSVDGSLEPFDSRFGKWGSAPAENLDNSRSPVLRELQRRSAAPDVRAPIAAQRVPQAGAGVPANAAEKPAPSSTDVAPAQSAQTPQPIAPLGLFTGKPMPNYSVPPPIWDFSNDDGSKGDNIDDWFDRWIRPLMEQ
jgi:hypothetical protein